MLKELTLFGEIDKVAIAVKRLQSFEPSEGYYLAFSGGKDSIVIKKLADLAGVKYDAHYNLTTVDPPELVRYIKDFHPDVEISRPNLTLWQLIPKKKMPPTRVVRYCCSELKEGNGKGRIVVTGVRWAESARRKANRNLVDIGGKTGVVLNDDNDEARRMVESCYRTQKTLVNPIVDWTDDEVWEFIRLYELPYCKLYDQGHKRLGCIGCPMTGEVGMKRDFERWPKYKKQYIRSFEKMLEARRAAGLVNKWQTGQDVFDWWIQDEHEQTPIEKIIEGEEETEFCL